MTSSLLANCALGISSLVLAVVFFYYHRRYQRPYLRLWFWSWLALTVYAVGAGISYEIAMVTPLSPWRTTASLLSLVAAYLQVVWLLAGAAEIATQRRAHPGWLKALLAGAVVAGVTSVVVGMSDPDGGSLRLLLRVGVRNLVTGVAFGLSGVFLWRVRTKHPVAGVRIVAATFLAYGLLLTQVSLVSLVPDWLGESYTALLQQVGPFDLVAVTLIGLGLVMWLLEEEHRRLVRTLGRVEELETRDPLTGLENRVTFLHQLERQLTLAGKTGQLTVVGVVDVDRFRDINDAFGHSQGDEILRRLADGLTASRRETDLVARLSGDQFAFALGGFSRAESAREAAVQYLQPLRFPFDLGARQVHCQLSVGLALAPRDGESAEEVLRHAHAAQRKVKAAGGNDLLVYSSKVVSRTAEDLDFERELRRVVGSGELLLRYQPVVSYPTRTLVGVEALLRWLHPAQGELTPGQFLPLAANLGLMQRIDRWVLSEACSQATRWQRAGSPIRVAVNLSAFSLGDPRLPEQIGRLLEELPLDPQRLRLEITEHDAVRDLDTGAACLAALRDRGVSVCIDDFGVGYSSFNLLDRLPIDTLKIDKSFIQRVGRDRREATIVSAMISMARSLGLAVIAEGVEEEAQARLLAREGCTHHQGYLYYRPLLASEISPLLPVPDSREFPPEVMGGPTSFA